MADIIVSAMIEDRGIRVLLANTREIVQKARKIHELSPVATIALGKTLSAIAMISCFSKGEKDNFTLKIKGEGPLGSIVTVGKHGDVRGYVDNPLVETVGYNSGKLNIKEAVGKNGYLYLIKDMGLKEPYVGISQMISGDITEDISYYFENSEQIPTIISLDVLMDKDNKKVKEAGGIIIQLMPEGDIEFMEYLKERVSSIHDITYMLNKGLVADDILKEIFGDTKITLNQNYLCKYKCNCSKDRITKNLITLGGEEIKKIIDEDGEAELQCHFCNTYYKFNTKQLNLIYKNTKS